MSAAFYMHNKLFLSHFCFNFASKQKTKENKAKQIRQEEKGVWTFHNSKEQPDCDVVNAVLVQALVQ